MEALEIELIERSPTESRLLLLGEEGECVWAGNKKMDGAGKMPDGLKHQVQHRLGCWYFALRNL